MIERLRELVTDPTSDEVDEQEPLSQMLLNSHSPVVLSRLEKDEAMFADMVSVVNPQVDKISRKTRIRPVKLHGALLPEENRQYVSMVEVERYLHSVDQEG
jgi:hypothetical protein